VRRGSTWRNVVVITVALVLIGASLGADVGAMPVRGGTLTIGLDQEPPTLDPEASPSAVTFQIISDVTESLLYQTPDGKLVPWLATSYTVSPDGKSFTFKLRTDVTFTDGTPLTAEAVKWNFDRIVNPNYRAGSAGPEVAGYTGSTVLDDHTVRLDFKAPFAPFLSYVAAGALAIVSPKATQAEGSAVNQKPVGSGPFVVSEYVAKDHITLTRNAAYNRRAPWSGHQGPPYVDRIVWKIIPEPGTRVATLQSGETQMISTLGVPAAVLSQLTANRGLRVEKQPYPGVPRIWLLNVKLAPTNDLKVRQALEYGINRAIFVSSVYKGYGTPACGPLTRHMLDDPSLCTMYPYDPKKAAQLLDEDGWKMGPNNVRMKGGQPLTLVINSINYGGGNLPEVELLQGQLLSLGVDAKIKSQARPPWYEDNYHCATNGPVMFLRSTDWDGLYALFSSTNIGSNFNWSCYSNAEVDELLRQGRETYDAARRRAIYDRVEHLVMQQAVAVPLFDELSVWVMRDTVKDVRYNYSAYPVLSDVYLQK